MNAHLSAPQKEMLIEVKKHFKWDKALDIRERGTSFILKNIEEEDAIDLRELCSEYLLEIGFDQEYRANEKGKILEALIDKLYVD